MVHLAGMYEEISLLHRLVRNMQITRSDIQAGQDALAALADILSAEGFVLKLNHQCDDERFEATEQDSDAYLFHGERKISESEVDDILDYLAASDLSNPIVLNPPETDHEDWPAPEIRQIVAAPLVEGNRDFGWILAFNDAKGNDYTGVAGSLVASVAGILGIHCDNTFQFRQRTELTAGVLRALTSAIDAKDPYTCGHSERVAKIAVRLARQLGCDRDSLQTIYFSGLLHDIGKIGIDDNLLRKPGRLSAAEFEHIMLHPKLGHKILRNLKQLDQALPAVLHHHEACDGSGYPDGLTGEDIPYLARIVAVADAVDAMASDRSFRSGMADDKIDRILREGAGKQWDSRVVDAFFAIREDLREFGHQQRARHEDEVPYYS